MVTTRSPWGMNEERQLSRVVFPEPVPPEMRTLSRAITIARIKPTIGGLSELASKITGVPVRRRGRRVRILRRFFERKGAARATT